MKLKPELTEYAEMNPTKETRQQTIEDLCRSIDSGMLTLPLYQRDLSWTLEKCVSLLNYQLKGKAPVSAISINVINNVNSSTTVPQVSFMDREMVELKPGLNSVIDGQQRITTNYKAYIGSQDFNDVVLDLSRGVFIALKEGDHIKSHQVPVNVLLHKDGGELTKYLEIHKKLQDFGIQNLLLKIRTKFKGYNYTINQAKDLSEEEQVNWFEVLNNAGSRVSENQMKLAKLKIRGIDIYTQFAHKYVEKIVDAGFEKVFTNQNTRHSYPLCALNPAYEVIVGNTHNNNYCPMAPDVRVESINSLNTEELLRAFEITLRALDRTLDFIETNKLKSPSRVDYINFIMGYFVFNSEEMKNCDKNFLLSWYCNVDFNNTSNTDRRNIYTKLINKVS